MGQNIETNKKMMPKVSDMSYFVKFNFYETTTDQEPYKIQKYEVAKPGFGELSKLLPFNDGSYTIRYIDSDGDLCTIDNDCTLKFALKPVPSSNTLTLRIDHKASGSRPNTDNDKEKQENQSTRRNLRRGHLRMGINT